MESSNLRYKINGAILITFALIAVIFSSILLPFQQQRFQTVMNKIELLLETLVERDRNHLGDELLDGRIRAIQIRLKQMMKVEGVLSIRIFDQKGGLVADSGAAGDHGDLSPEMMKAAVLNTQIRSGRIEGEPALLYVQELRMIGERIGFIRICYSLADVRREQRRSFLIFSGLLLSILIVMTLLLNLILSRMIINPVRALQDASGEIARGRLDEFIDTRRNDEIGKLARSFMIMRDAIRKQINDLQVLNRRIETQNEDLKKADRLKDEFLSNTSHELRTPLIGINGVAESLLDGAAGPLNRAQEENIEIIASSGRRLASLVNDILDFSRLKNQDLDLSFKSVDLKSIADLVLILSQHLVQAKGVSLENLIPPDLKPVYADENRLEQILHNLIGNAVKFTEQGGVTVNAYQDGETTVITVSDTGIGIPEDKLESIFKSFEQADGSIARKFRGTGLGLSITKKLVELHGGWIQADSKPGKGSEFTFALPVSHETARPFRARDIRNKPVQISGVFPPPVMMNTGYEGFEAERQQEPGAARHHILIVDDEPVNLLVLQNQLTLRRYAVTKASSGEEAVRILEHVGGFSLVILDVMMPGVTGYETCRRIRERYQANELPVIMLTAKNQVDDLIAGLQSGANDYLVKPFSKEELFARIETHLNLKSLSAETIRLEVDRKSAELSSKAKSEFISNMSHELRTPLNAILGFSQLMQQDTELANHHQEYLSIIRRGGAHLLTLINDVLDMSKIEAGRTDINTNRFNPHFFLDDLKEMMRLKADTKGLGLNFLKSPDIPSVVQTDETKLRQILMNLIGNAIKFTREGGVVVRARMRAAESGEGLYFEIEDTGPGVTPEEAALMFKPFAQTATGLRSRSGTGLGLAISKKFIQLMGGDIQVRSHPGQGTAVCFDIPLQPADGPEHDAENAVSPGIPVSIAPDQPCFRLLAVDNSPDNRKLLVKFLEPFGFELLEAENGREAVDTWRIHKPHLIWMDIKMPVMDGYEAARSIRRMESAESGPFRFEETHGPPERQTVIIALTASAFGDEQMSVREAGCDDFLMKPYREHEIFDLLNKHLGVRFIYDTNETDRAETEGREPVEGLAPETVAALPVEWLTDLQKGAESIDPELLYSVVDRIRGQDQTTADHLARLADRYDYEAILRLIRSPAGELKTEDSA